LPSGKIQAGDRFDVGLYWQAHEPLSERLQMTLRFVNSQASIVAEATDEPVRSTYPTSNWAPGEIVRDIRSIRLEPSAASGIVSVVVQVRDEAGRPVGSEMPIGTIEVEARPLVTELPPIQNSLEVQFDDVATL